MSTVTMISANLLNAGVDAGDDRRCGKALEILGAHEPDVVFGQELSADPSWMAATSETLGMECLLSPEGRGPHRTGIWLREQAFASRSGPWPHHGPWRLRPTDVAARLPEAPKFPLILMSVHCDFASRGNRILETEYLTGVFDKTKRRHGVVVAGDFNEAPTHADDELAPPIDWNSDAITDTFHRVHRAKRGPGGAWTPCDDVDRILRDTDRIHDAARYAARVHGQRRALAPTCGHHPDAEGQGGQSRIDRVYMDSWLATAIEHVEVIDMSDVSDHHAVKVVLSRPQLAAALHREVSPAPMHTA